MVDPAPDEPFLQLPGGNVEIDRLDEQLRLRAPRLLVEQQIIALDLEEPRILSDDRAAGAGDLDRPVEDRHGDVGLALPQPP